MSMSGGGAVHFDLAQATVDGHPIFGRSVAAIRSSLGPPDYVERYAHRVDLGYGARSRPRLEVIFNGTAWAIELEDPGAVEAQLGRPLALAPQALQTLIARRYAGLLRLVRAYRCDPKGCFGLFFNTDGSRRVIFGVSRGHRYIGLQLTHPP
jgi:hypothetical protein